MHLVHVSAPICAGTISQNQHASQTCSKYKSICRLATEHFIGQECGAVALNV